MSLFLKIAAAIIGLIILIIGGAAIYLSTLFDANNYKSEIQALVKQQTQLELKIDGELKLSVFPWLGVSVENTSVDTADGHLASAGFVKIFAKFVPLLTGQVEIDGIALHDLKLQLVRNAKGQGNWQLTSPTKAKSPSSSSPKTSEIGASGFTLGYLDIENADISYKDLSTGTFHQLQNMTLRISKVSANSEFPVSIDFAYLNNDLSNPVKGHLTSQVLLNLDKQTLSLADTVLDIGSTRINTTLEAQKLLETPFIDGRFNLVEFKTAEWGKILQQPTLADMALDLDAKADFQFDSGKGQAALQNLSIASQALEIQGAVNINYLNDATSYLGKLTINQLNPRRLLENLNIDVTHAHNSALNSLSGLLDFKGTENDIQITNLNVKLDDTNLKGNAGINSFNNLASNFSLMIDQINLDSYLPPTQVEPASQANSPTSSSAPEVDLLPLDTLRELNTRGDLRIGKLIASGLQIDNLNAKLRAANGFINLQSLTASLYEGNINTSASIDARSNNPQFNFDNQLTGIQAEPLLKALSETDYLAGNMNLQVNGTAFGNSLSAIKKTITGETSFNITDGILKNTNVEQLVCKSVARIRDRQYTPDPQQPNTQFRELSGHANIVKGIVKTDRLTIALNNIHVNGSGQINLPEENLDFGIRANIKGDMENQACEVHERYRDVAWPIRCQGGFDDEPSKLCGLDQRELQNIAAQLAKKEVQRKVNDKLEDKLKDKLGDEAAEQLRGILGF